MFDFVDEFAPTSLRADPYAGILPVYSDEVIKKYPQYFIDYPFVEGHFVLKSWLTENLLKIEKKFLRVEGEEEEENKVL